MCTFDLDQAEKTLAPRMTNEQRLEYLAIEKEFIEEILEDTSDCKWVYLSLIECCLLEGKIIGTLTAAAKADMMKWLEQVKQLDPLRQGRWKDLEDSLGT